MSEINNKIQAEIDVVVPVLTNTDAAILMCVRRDMYIRAGAMYNDTLKVVRRKTFWGEEVDHLPGHYYLNGLGDITEQEMELIYQNKDVSRMMVNNCVGILRGSRLRTTLPASDTLNYYSLFQDGYEMLRDSAVEVLNIADGQMVSVNRLDLGFAVNLVAIKDILDLSHYVYTFQWTEGLVNLKYIKLYNACYSIELKDSPLLQKECLLYMIDNFSNKVDSDHSIVVHPDVYAKCKDGGEWHEDVIVALESKNQQMINGGSINLGCA